MKITTDCIIKIIALLVITLLVGSLIYAMITGQVDVNRM